MLKLPVSFLVIFIPTCHGIIVKCVDLDIRVYVKAFQLKKATDAMKAKIIQQINDYNHLDYHIQEPKYRIEDVPNGVLFSFLRIGKEDFIDMESSQISHTLTTYRVNAKIPPRTGIYTKK